jgi:hypothetical protein
MHEEIKSIEAIEREAKEAARQYDNINDACPYSFYTDAGQAFKKAFQKERLAIYMATKAIPAAPQKAKRT